MNEEELGGGIIVLTPNILFEIPKAMPNVEEVTKEFYFFRTFWKFRVRRNERNTRKIFVSMIVHKAPINYTRLYFSVTCGILTKNEDGIIEQNVDRVSLDDLITNRISHVEIWAQNLSGQDLWDQTMFPGQTLKFFCRVEVQSRLKDLKELSEEQDTPPCAKYFGEDVKSLLDESTMTDIILKCRDQNIRAHKCILSCRSTVFHRIFQSDFEETQKGIVEIPDIELIEPKVFQKLLDYLYSGNIDTTDESVESICKLYKIAHMYGMETLKKRCVFFLKENLDLQHACSVLYMSNIYEDSNLKEYVVSYLAKRREFLLTEKWKVFAKNNLEMAQDVLLLYLGISHLK